MKQVGYDSSIIGSCYGVVEVSDTCDEEELYDKIYTDIHSAITQDPNGILDIDIYLEDEE